MQLIDLSSLGAQLLTISAVTKVLVDLLKPSLKTTKHASVIKTVASYLIPIVITSSFGISLFLTANQTAFYIGCVLAGAIAGLGSTYVHEVLKALQTLKGLKK